MKFFARKPVLRLPPHRHREQTAEPMLQSEQQTAESSQPNTTNAQAMGAMEQAMRLVFFTILPPLPADKRTQVDGIIQEKCRAACASRTCKS
ncbi:MAG: hypothetical protein HY939_01695 [Gammaproteobacteria bacterium]|nr:hypothetical protein [Gammaproteobacteria bacterium]